MKTFKPLCRTLAVLSLVIPSACFAAAPDKGRDLVEWSPLSSTASSITGAVALGADRLVIDGKHIYRLTLIRKLGKQEAETTAKLVGAQNLSNAALFGVDIPGTSRFEGGNTICGRSSITKVIVAKWRDLGQDSLSLVFFEGSKELYFPGWEDAPDGLCGTFNYVK